VALEPADLGEDRGAATVGAVVASRRPRRVEAELHYYKVSHTGLVELGLSPHLLSDTPLTSLYAVADRYKHRADPAALRPAVH
jgi:hypothetical protein